MKMQGATRVKQASSGAQAAFGRRSEQWASVL